MRVSTEAMKLLSVQTKAIDIIYLLLSADDDLFI